MGGVPLDSVDHGRPITGSNALVVVSSGSGNGSSSSSNSRSGSSVVLDVVGQAETHQEQLNPRRNLKQGTKPETL